MKNYVIGFLLLLSFRSIGQPGFSKIYQLDSTHAERWDSIVEDQDTLVVLRGAYDPEVNKWGMNLLKTNAYILAGGKSSNLLIAGVVATPAFNTYSHE